MPDKKRHLEEVSHSRRAKVDFVLQVPLMTIEGNHEIEEDAAGRSFLSYTARYRMPSDESSSPSQLYYSFDHGGTSCYTLISLVNQHGECVFCAHSRSHDMGLVSNGHARTNALLCPQKGRAAAT